MHAVAGMVGVIGGYMMVHGAINAVAPKQPQPVRRRVHRPPTKTPEQQFSDGLHNVLQQKVKDDKIYNMDNSGQQFGMSSGYSGYKEANFR